MHILAMVMTVVMIIHVRSKFTAVGWYYLQPFTQQPTWLTNRRPQRDHDLLLHLSPSDYRVTCP